MGRWSGGVWADVTFYIVIINNVFQKKVETLTRRPWRPHSLSSSGRVLLPWTFCCCSLYTDGVSFIILPLSVLVVFIVRSWPAERREQMIMMSECGKQDDNVFWISRTTLIGFNASTAIKWFSVGRTIYSRFILYFRAIRCTNRLLLLLRCNFFFTFSLSRPPHLIYVLQLLCAHFRAGCRCRLSVLQHFKVWSMWIIICPRTILHG